VVCWSCLVAVVRDPLRLDVVPLVAMSVESHTLGVVPVVLVHDPSIVPDVQRVAVPAIEEVGRVIEEVENWPKESHKPIHHFHTHAHSHDYRKSVQVLEK
jgi:hypothetical protein